MNHITPATCRNIGQRFEELHLPLALHFFKPDFARSFWFEHELLIVRDNPGGRPDISFAKDKLLVDLAKELPLHHDPIEPEDLYD